MENYPTVITYTPTKALLVSMVSMGMTIGTGGGHTEQYVEHLIGSTSNFRIHLTQSQCDNVKKPSVAEALNNIQTALKIPKTDLNKLFGVSRQALYPWFKGQNISDANEKRVYEILTSLEVIEDKVHLLTKYALRRPIKNGKSLIELVASGNDAKDVFTRLISILEIEAEQRNKLNARLSGRVVDAYGFSQT